MPRDPLTDLLDEARQITDPIERARRFTELIDDLGTATNLASEDRQKALTEALEHMTPAKIADALGLTRARVSQMLKARTGIPPERALLAPSAGRVTFAVVEKRDAEGGQPVISVKSRVALTKLEELASSMGLETTEERVPPPGLLDLNQDNLVILIGPRVSSLIAQVVASDPAIQWRRDKRGHWYLVDVKTGENFHSDFDEGWTPTHGGERNCIAHIGRIRRPDGHGSFLYLGGAHSAGTAGAAEVFTREFSSIWEQAKRSNWSAVVLTKVGEDGEVLSAELATPIYVHGKR